MRCKNAFTELKHQITELNQTIDHELLIYRKYKELQKSTNKGQDDDQQLEQILPREEMVQLLCRLDDLNDLRKDAFKQLTFINMQQNIATNVVYALVMMTKNKHFKTQTIFDDLKRFINSPDFDATDYVKDFINTDQLIQNAAACELISRYSENMAEIHYRTSLTYKSGLLLLPCMFTGSLLSAILPSTTQQSIFGLITTSAISYSVRKFYEYQLSKVAIKGKQNSEIMEKLSNYEYSYIHTKHL